LKKADLPKAERPFLLVWYRLSDDIYPRDYSIFQIGVDRSRDC